MRVTNFGGGIFLQKSRVPKSEKKKFNNIIPCGINNYGITSIEQLGVKICYKDFDALLKEKFRLLFDNY